MTTPALPGLFGAVEPTLNHYGYLAVAVLVMLEDFGIPVPGETIVIAASLFAGAGRLNVVLVGVVATAAAIIGDNIGFAIGHFGGRTLALRFGKYVFLTEERLDKAEYFFEHHGGKIIVLARFIEGLRQANGIVAGISGMHWRRFLGFNALGAALWVGVWVSLGYLAGSHITTIYNQITRYSLYAVIALVVVVVAFTGRWLWHRRRRRQGRTSETAETSKAPEAAETGETGETCAPSNTPEPETRPEANGRSEAVVPAETRGASDALESGIQHETPEPGVHVGESDRPDT